MLGLEEGGNIYGGTGQPSTTGDQCLRSSWSADTQGLVSLSSSCPLELKLFSMPQVVESGTGSLVLSLPAALGSVRGAVPVVTMSPSHLLSVWYLCPFLCRSWSVSPQFFFWRNYSICVDFVCPWRGVQGLPPSPPWTLSPESISFDCPDYYNLPSCVTVCIRKYSKGWLVLSKCSK